MIPEELGASSVGTSIAGSSTAVGGTAALLLHIQAMTKSRRAEAISGMFFDFIQELLYRLGDLFVIQIISSRK
jgi:hypothetical protein